MTIVARIPAAQTATRPASGSYRASRDGFVYSDPMEPEGLTDKLFWRKTRGEWHCFMKLPEVRGYNSLCRRREIGFVHGRQIARPDADLRCNLCDELEMARRGWNGSGPGRVLSKALGGGLPCHRAKSLLLSEYNLAWFCGIKALLLFLLAAEYFG